MQANTRATAAPMAAGWMLLCAFMIAPALGCDGVTRVRTGVEEGALRVVTETEGDPADADGYTAVAIDPLDQRFTAPVGISDSVVIGELRSDLEYTVTLEDVDEPCAVSDEDPKSVLILEGDTARASFEVTCVE